jgi:hypothetical protein
MRVQRKLKRFSGESGWALWAVSGFREHSLRGLSPVSQAVIGVMAEAMPFQNGA